MIFLHLGYGRRNFRPAINFTLHCLLHHPSRLHLLHRSSTLGYRTSRFRQSIRSTVMYTASSVANLVGIDMQSPISPSKRRMDLPGILPGKRLCHSLAAKSRLYRRSYRQGPALPPSCFASTASRLAACHGTETRKREHSSLLKKYRVRVIASLSIRVHRSPILQSIRPLLIRYPGLSRQNGGEPPGGVCRSKSGPTTASSMTEAVLDC